MGIQAILLEVVGGLIGGMGGKILIGMLLFLPFALIPAVGSVVSIIKLIKAKTYPNKKIETNPNVQKLDEKYEELEKLESLDHDLYVQLTQELSKSNKSISETYEKCKLTTKNNMVIDEHETVVEL